MKRKKFRPIKHWDRSELEIARYGAQKTATPEVIEAIERELGYFGTMALFARIGRALIDEREL